MNIINKVINKSEAKRVMKQLAPRPSSIISSTNFHSKYLFIVISLLSYLITILLTSFVILIGQPEFSALSIGMIQTSLISWVTLIFIIFIIISYIIMYGTHTSIIYNKNTINLLIQLGASNNFVISKIVYSFTKIGLTAGLTGSFAGLITIIFINPFLLQISRLFNNISDLVVVSSNSVYAQYYIFMLIPLFIVVACSISSYVTVKRLVKKYY